MRRQAIFRLFVPLKHWGETFKYAASVIGLPIGDYPFSYRPQGRLPEVATADPHDAREGGHDGQDQRAMGALTDDPDTARHRHRHLDHGQNLRFVGGRNGRTRSG